MKCQTRICDQVISPNPPLWFYVACIIGSFCGVLFLHVLVGDEPLIQRTMCPGDSMDTCLFTTQTGDTLLFAFLVSCCLLLVLAAFDVPRMTVGLLFAIAVIGYFTPQLSMDYGGSRIDGNTVIEKFIYLTHETFLITVKLLPAIAAYLYAMKRIPVLVFLFAILGPYSVFPEHIFLFAPSVLFLFVYVACTRRLREKFLNSIDSAGEWKRHQV